MDWLLQPETRVLLVSNRLSARSSFEDLLREGENLLRVVERFRSGPNVRPSPRYLFFVLTHATGSSGVPLCWFGWNCVS